MSEDRLKELLDVFADMPDISCPTCGREIYCGKLEDLCSIRPCGLIEKRKQQELKNERTNQRT